ncbi:hypothetical protein F511_07266 [Dorcoceras hygrometricum]|uniref:Uncharacterized protein n=1 Tax=Dorcoceras hygrometricum TaxID=472368 RepID=A0A2Z7B1K0_9LAMI|nr:hypothetical protein F511_07266 [Dorcoceras hygrometricum]
METNLATKHEILLRLRQSLNKPASLIQSELAPDRTSVAYPFRFNVQNLRNTKLCVENCKERQIQELVSGSSELNLLRLIFFHCWKDLLEYLILQQSVLAPASCENS